jgi:ribonuclease III
MSEIKKILKKFNIRPRNLEIYQLAFTHTSFNKDNNQVGTDYQRLEFMGDAIISLAVAELVFRLHPDWDQGQMSKTRAKLVQTEMLASIASKYNLADYVIVGTSITKEKVANSKKILEDIFEAFIGAVYIDQGFKVTNRLLSKLFYQMVKNIEIDTLTDYKTQLQEQMQADYRESVTYQVVSETGPAHNKRFKVTVKYNDTILGTGFGSSKKTAEQNAAQQALSKKVSK